jgi:glycerol kinase
MFDSFVLTCAEGEHHITDVTNASRTLLMNLESLDWDEDILSIMKVPRGMLPKIVRYG